MANPPGYELAEEVDSGGMGVVHRAFDVAMNRQVAFKILLETYSPESSMAERFTTEAQITGQLHHRGIPAVYHVGKEADGEPFLTTQAVGYAHAHQVIHRNLKPSNVMVGPFGEVQVMDRVLAKVLARRATPPARVADPDAIRDRTTISTLRESDVALTQAGSVVGTLAYMAPEQAAGESERVDRRSDVFGLGAILCALLTGRPPYTGPDPESVRVAAVRCQTEGAFVRLDRCGAEPDLVALCNRCLGAEPADRPAEASAVAAEIAALRAAADDRARQAELARARAEVQAEEQRKRRRVVQAAALGGAAVLLLGIVGTMAGLVPADRARRDAQEARAVAEDKESAAVDARNAEARHREIAEADLLGPDHFDTPWTMDDLSCSLVEAGRGAEATPILDECYRRAEGKQPIARMIPLLLDLRSRRFQAVRDVSGCRETAGMLEKLGHTDRSWLYNPACMRAVTAELIGDAPGSAAEAQSAMDGLRKAVAAGSNDRGDVQADRDLDALGSRADFGELIATIPGPNPVPPPAGPP